MPDKITNLKKEIPKNFVKILLIPESTPQLIIQIKPPWKQLKFPPCYPTTSAHNIYSLNEYLTPQEHIEQRQEEKFVDPNP